MFAFVVASIRLSDCGLFCSIQIVQSEDKRVDGSVEGGDLELKAGLLAVGARGSELTVKRQHLVDEVDHLVMHCLVGRIGEIDRTDWQLGEKLAEESVETTTDRSTDLLPIRFDQRAIE